MADARKPEDCSDRSYWARTEDVHHVRGDYPSQDCVALDPELVRDIRDGHGPGAPRDDD